MTPLSDSRKSASRDPWWWNRWTVAIGVVLGAFGVALLLWDFVQIALEVRAMR